jgi:hypothetical protein
VKGSLQDMAVADLIQHTCQDRKTARVLFKNGREKGELFIKNGNVVHASIDDQTGEEAVYQLMNWDQGTFDLVPDLDPPAITITRTWTSLLLEAARLSDETAPERERQKEAERTAGLTRGEDERFVEIIQEFSVATPQQLVEQLSGKIEGHRLTCLTRIRGGSLYWYSSRKLEIEETIEQVNQFVKMVSTAAKRLNAGSPVDDLLVTERDYLLVRFIGRDDFYLIIVAEKEKANLGTLRHLARVYSERLVSSLKLEGVI